MISEKQGGDREEKQKEIREEEEQEGKKEIRSRKCK